MTDFEQVRLLVAMLRSKAEFSITETQAAALEKVLLIAERYDATQYQHRGQNRDAS